MDSKKNEQDNLSEQITKFQNSLEQTTKLKLENQKKDFQIARLKEEVDLRWLEEQMFDLLDYLYEKSTKTKENERTLIEYREVQLGLSAIALELRRRKADQAIEDFKKIT